ncbi:MAG: EamA family transporter [Bryobacteraceae bacterium]
MSTAIELPSDTLLARQKRQSMILVFICTLFGAPAQILIKTGAGHVPQHAGLLTILLAMAANLHLVAGYSLYGISFLLMAMALKHGELSIMYPIIALTQVWVTILSVWIFHDSMNPYKIFGIASVVLGVGVLGRASKT